MKQNFFVLGKLGGITDDYPTAAYQAFAELCSNFLRFLKQNSEDEKDMKELSYGTYCKIWSGTEIVAQLKLLGVNEESYSQLLVRALFFGLKQTKLNNLEIRKRYSREYRNGWKVRVAK